MHRWLFKVNLPHVFPCVGNIFILQPSLVLRDIHTALQHPGKKIKVFFFLKKSKKKKTQNKTKPKKEENCIFCRPKYCFLTVKSNISKWENIFCFHAISARLRSPPLSTDVNRCGEQKGTRKRKEKSQSCHKRLVLVPSLLLEAAVREV